MKITKVFGLLYIITSAFLSSCRSNASFTKRHYKKGYYVSYRENKRTDHSLNENLCEDKKAIPVTRSQSNVQSKDHTIQLFSKQYNFALSEEKYPTTQLVAIQKAKKTTSISPSYFNQQKILKITPSQLKPKKISNKSIVGEGLSLLWIVIVVLLILWLLGILTSSFGIGGLINLFLVIALVLLILWLLRIM